MAFEPAQHSFITLEGVDGAGKSTQARLLARALELAGYQVVSLREPGGTAISEKIRALLLDPANTAMGDTCELLLYEAARAQLVHEVIAPALAAGKVVLCDRFYDSTTCYQAFADGLDRQMVRDANNLAVAGTHPALTLVYHITPEQAALRMAVRGAADRMEAKGMAFQERVYQGFCAIAAEEPNRVKLIDATASIEDVFAQTVEQVRAYGLDISQDAVAAALAKDGCGSCDSCVRVARHTHPDVHYYTPESATGYLIAQTRELLDDVPLAPIRAKAKVYIIDRAEQLRANTANALLKTLEEPPEGVMFILLGTSADVMLPTIVSRCQCVPFRLVSPAVAAQAVSRATGQDPARCRMAVAVAGSPTRGIEFLKSAERQDARRQMVRAIDSLIVADEADVLSRAKSLIVAVKAPLAEVKSTQEKVLEQNADYLSRGALKQLEDRNKRELNARERSGIMEALASARTLMRDVLLTLQDEAADVVNEDVRDTIGRLAAATNVAGATRALEAVATAERNIARNVTPQLAIEVMLFDIRKALKCR